MRAVKIIAIVVALVLVAMIWQGQTTEAANVVKGGGGTFLGNFGTFIGKLFS